MLNKKIVFLIILMIFITINTVSAEDNLSGTDIVLNTTDQVIVPENPVYHARLQSDNNSLITNQSVIFSVNGINYTKLTDANGIASLNINLDDGVYSISTTFRELTNTNKIYVSHVNGTLIEEGLSNSQIQSIIDNAASESTLIFVGKNYENIALTINKSLNIISIVKSELIGKSNNPVIKISSNGMNSNISNFIIKNGNVGILVDGADNVGISNNKITNNVNGIYLVNSNNTVISKNTISNNYNGIYFDSNVLNTNISGNIITNSENTAIYLAKSGSHTTITSNTINSNVNGIFIDMVGDEDLNIESNTIQWNEEGVVFGENYRKTNESGVLNIYQNAIAYNDDFNILGKESIYNTISLRDNYVASTDPTQTRVCNKIKFKKLALNMNQINGNTIRVSVSGLNTNFQLGVSYNNGRNWEYVTVNGGEGSEISVSNADGNLVLDYFESLRQFAYQLVDYVAPTPTTPETPSENPTTDDTNAESNSNGNGEGINSDEITNGTSSSSSNSGVASTNNVVSDVSTGVESTSTEASQAESSESASTEASQSESSESTSASEPNSVSKSIAKTLNIDEDVVKIAGLGLIILLIIAVIGLYYRDDIKYMLNNRNE